MPAIRNDITDTLEPNERAAYLLGRIHEKNDSKHSQQLLLESLEEDYKEMRKKSKVDEVLKECDSEWHEGFLVGIERFEALIQSKKEEL